LQNWNMEGYQQYCMCRELDHSEQSPEVMKLKGRFTFHHFIMINAVVRHESENEEILDSGGTDKILPTGPSKRLQGQNNSGL